MSEALEMENARAAAAALETLETAEAAAPFAGDAADGTRDRALDALRHRVAVAEAAAAMAREEASESRRATRAELAEGGAISRERRAEKAEASSARDRRGYEAAMEENARLRRAAAEGGGGGEGAARERAVAAAEAKAARLHWDGGVAGGEGVAAVASRGKRQREGAVFGLRAAETGAEIGAIKSGGLSPPLFERVLRDKSHRRAVVIGYLAVLHLLVYFSTTHGTFSHGARVRCVSGVAPGTAGA